MLIQLIQPRCARVLLYLSDDKAANNKCNDLCLFKPTMFLIKIQVFWWTAKTDYRANWCATIADRAKVTMQCQSYVVQLPTNAIQHDAWHPLSKLPRNSAAQYATGAYNWQTLSLNRVLAFGLKYEIVLLATPFRKQPWWLVVFMLQWRFADRYWASRSSNRERRSDEITLTIFWH